MFGCSVWGCQSISTIGSPEVAITAIANNPKKAAYIEARIPGAENTPLSEKALDSYFKLRTLTGI